MVNRDEENLNLQKVKNSTLGWLFKWHSYVRTLVINYIQTMPWSHRPLEPCCLSCVLSVCAFVCQTEEFPTFIKLLAAALQEKRGNGGGHYCQWWSKNVKTQFLALKCMTVEWAKLMKSLSRGVLYEVSINWYFLFQLICLYLLLLQ